ncbi:LysR family transcriptional regulator [Aquisalimonas lutea]|uniref:LysR family transcriptional regulator n=1 Tax=Aquisalimonas lutea TaxID=1327750 RepID=UPI0025B36E8C|nr:LysR family transcriptional regulator [Aquisalimonas lutea]MDN3516550.1 LysR family transcriptional regulator [Aquisalimonas lutea]
MQRLFFDFVDLRLFVNIAETRSLTRGAERSFTSLAAASMRIKNLEDALETKLLHRASHGVTLTPAGEAMLHHALIILQQAERLRGDLLEYATGVKGCIRMLANTTAMTEFLPAALGEFLSSHPQVDVALEERMSHDIVRAVAEGSADIGIVAGNVPTGGLEVRSYQTDRLVLATPLGHPLADREVLPIQDALDYDFVSLHSGSAIYAFMLQVASDLGVRLPVRVQVSSFDALCRMVAAGAGIGVLQASSAHRLARTTDIHVIELSDAWAERRLKICAQDMDALPSFARELVDYLVATVPQS